jgi:hypothetical protein
LRCFEPGLGGIACRTPAPASARVPAATPSSLGASVAPAATRVARERSMRASADASEPLAACA